MSNTVHIYAYGIVHISVCAPKSMPLEEMLETVNVLSPTGITSRWQKSKEPTFSTGQPNPCPCESDENRLHYLLSC